MPFLATLVTLMYYRLTAAHGQPAEPGGYGAGGPGPGGGYGPGGYGPGGYQPGGPGPGDYGQYGGGPA
jgi:hypothetical protein